MASKRYILTNQEPLACLWYQTDLSPWEVHPHLRHIHTYMHLVAGLPIIPITCLMIKWQNQSHIEYCAFFALFYLIWWKFRSLCHLYLKFRNKVVSHVMSLYFVNHLSCLMSVVIGCSMTLTVTIAVRIAHILPLPCYSNVTGWDHNWNRQSSARGKLGMILRRNE